ncbi:MAG: hydrogenase maturation nickel metallochaperone HypA [Armatimonadetes bacterium]|nr:hydrogenase maturation nickel metallochaperone HypA [Armatimonadota bacterium]
MHDIQRSHEIVQVVLEAAREQGAERIERINLVIGELTFLSPDQVRFWVGELLKDTIGEGAEVVIETQRPKVRCRACGYEGEVAVEDDPIYHYSTMVPACPECGSTEIEVIAGDECVIESLQAAK